MKSLEYSWLLFSSPLHLYFKVLYNKRSGFFLNNSVMHTSCNYIAGWYNYYFFFLLLLFFFKKNLLAQTRVELGMMLSMLSFGTFSMARTKLRLDSPLHIMCSCCVALNCCPVMNPLLWCWCQGRGKLANGTWGGSPAACFFPFLSQPFCEGN